MTGSPSTARSAACRDAIRSASSRSPLKTASPQRPGGPARTVNDPVSPSAGGVRSSRDSGSQVVRPVAGSVTGAPTSPRKPPSWLGISRPCASTSRPCPNPSGGAGGGSSPGRMIRLRGTFGSSSVVSSARTCPYGRSAPTIRGAPVDPVPAGWYSTEPGGNADSSMITDRFAGTPYWSSTVPVVPCGRAGRPSGPSTRPVGLAACACRRRISSAVRTSRSPGTASTAGPSGCAAARPVAPADSSTRVARVGSAGSPTRSAARPAAAVPAKPPSAPPTAPAALASAPPCPWTALGSASLVNECSDRNSSTTGRRAIFASPSTAPAAEAAVAMEVAGPATAVDAPRVGSASAQATAATTPAINPTVSRMFPARSRPVTIASIVFAATS